MPGPGGINDLSECQFQQLDDRTVKVSGSKFVKDRSYKVKLEGAAFVGYRSINIVGVRDPIFIEKGGEILDAVEAKVKEKFPKDKYRILFHLYGKNAVMGPLEPLRDARPHEMGIVTQVVADDPQLATEICEYANITMMFQHYGGQKCTAGNIACLGSMEVYLPLHREVYEWSIDHLLELDDPCECFSMTIEEVGS